MPDLLDEANVKPFRNNLIGLNIMKVIQHDDDLQFRLMYPLAISKEKTYDYKNILSNDDTMRLCD